MADNYTDATDTDFKAENYNIDEGKKLSAEGMRAALHTKEKVANKTDVINSSNNSSNAQYPSVKAVYTLDGGAVHKAGAETITGVKTFGAADTVAEPKLGAAKTTDAANDGTKFATEAQVYAVKSAIGSKQDGLPVGTILLFDGAGWRDNA
ncbi:MAG: hypothetical protein LBJ25_06105, partial [Candidatus Margulisbacteria bacterium]|nr:hypothetical protein [Candidatus Margulisiibacteriota bacterium]